MNRSATTVSGLGTNQEPLVTALEHLRNATHTLSKTEMPQINRTERKTIVLRVPRKYRYLVRTFTVWLKEYPDQALLWQCEEYLSQTFEASAYKVNSPAWRQEINAAQVKVFNHIKFSR